MVEGFCLVNECVGHLMSFFRFVGQHLPPEIWQYFVRIFPNVFNNCRMKNNEYFLCCHRSYKMQLEIIQDWGWWYLCKSNQKTKSSNKRINQRIFQQQQKTKETKRKYLVSFWAKWSNNWAKTDSKLTLFLSYPNRKSLPGNFD